MRPLGLILIVLGVVALLVRSFTFFTTQTEVGPLGYFAWDVSRPHTLFISTVAGIAALVVGLVLVAMSRRPTNI
jgi:hypothetical protein